MSSKFSFVRWSVFAPKKKVKNNFFYPAFTIGNIAPQLEHSHTKFDLAFDLTNGAEMSSRDDGKISKRIKKSLKADQLPKKLKTFSSSD